MYNKKKYFFHNHNIPTETYNNYKYVTLFCKLIGDEL